MNFPLASCITPTANREKYLPLAVQYFLEQDYPNKELIILDDGLRSNATLIPDDPRIRYYYYPDKQGSIGMKRNQACALANGEFIVHLDDDDYYAKDWVSRQINALLDNQADISGMNAVDFYSPVDNKRYKYEDKQLEKPWICGATMAFRKSFWEQHHFEDIQVGEDYAFIWNTGARLYALDYPKGFVANLHAHNTSLKPVENPKYKKHALAWNRPDLPNESSAQNDPLVDLFCGDNTAPLDL
jgi:glycosyltransferase involved in cell wall biosynthesis